MMTRTYAELAIAVKKKLSREDAAYLLAERIAIKECNGIPARDAAMQAVHELAGIPVKDMEQKPLAHPPT